MISVNHQEHFFFNIRLTIPKKAQKSSMYKYKVENICQVPTTYINNEFRAVNLSRYSVVQHTVVFDYQSG